MSSKHTRGLWSVLNSQPLELGNAPKKWTGDSERKKKKRLVLVFLVCML